MALQLGLLPMEVLDDILVKLDAKTMLALLEFHPPLQRAIDHWIFKESNIKETMVLACKDGDEALIRRALAHDADPSLSGLSIGTTNPRTFPTSNLLLTLHRKHSNCFTLLLEAGANVDGIHRNQQRQFFRLLVRPDNQELLRTYVQSRASFQPVTEGRKIKYDFTLVDAILGKVPIDIISAMLDRGADPDQLTYVGQQTKLSPLSAAIKLNNEPVFDMLIEKGANIHGPPVEVIWNTPHAYPYSRSSQVPIFAAVETIGHFETSLLQKCVQLGADINATSWVLPQTDWNYADTTTPLLTYIKIILGGSQFKKPEEAAKAIEGLALMMKCGASLKTPHPIPTTFHIGKANIGELWIVAYLLIKHGVSRLCDPVFFRTIKFLAENACRADNFDYIPDFFHSVSPRFNLTPERPAALVFPKWNEILALVIKQALPPDRPIAKDELLKSLILQLAFMFDMRMWKELLTSTIEHLLESGASLNTPTGPNRGTILHEICRMDPAPNRSIANPINVRLKFWACSFSRGMGKCGHLRAILELFKYLLAKGADPHARDIGGHTPLEILESHSTRHRVLIEAFGEDDPLDQRSEAIRAIAVVLGGGEVTWTNAPPDSVKWDLNINCHLRDEHSAWSPYRYI